MLFERRINKTPRYTANAAAKVKSVYIIDCHKNSRIKIQHAQHQRASRKHRSTADNEL